MGLINYSNIEDGTTIDAADVNTPLTTIYNDYNGNIDSNNLADNAVTTAKIGDGAVTNAKLSTTAGELGREWTSWTPTFSASNPMTWTSVTVSEAKYLQIGKTVFFRIRAGGTTGGTASNQLQFTLPTNQTSSESISIASGFVGDGSSSAAFSVYVNASTIGIRKYDSSNYGLGTSRLIGVSGFYEAA